MPVNKICFCSDENKKKRTHGKETLPPNRNGLRVAGCSNLKYREENTTTTRCSITKLARLIFINGNQKAVFFSYHQAHTICDDIDDIIAFLYSLRLTWMESTSFEMKQRAKKGEILFFCVLYIISREKKNQTKPMKRETIK